MIKKIAFGLVSLLLVNAFVFAQDAVDLTALTPITAENAAQVEVLADLSDEAFDIRHGALSPDGTVLAYFTAGAEEDAFRVMALETGDVLAETLYGKDDETAPEFVTFTPEGNLIFLQAGGLVNEIDIASGEATEIGNYVVPTDFSADGSFSTGVTIDMAAQSISLNVWDGDGAELANVSLAGFPVSLPVISEDGSRIAIVLEDGLYVIDAANPVLEAPLAPLTSDNMIENIAISADGAWIAGVDTGNVYQVFVWDAATGENAYTLDRSGGEVDGLDFVAFSPDGSLLYFTEYNVLFIADAATGDVLHEVQVLAEGGRVAAFGMNADGSLLFAGAYHNLSLIGIPAE